jgi:dihydroneopterin aldolase
VNINLTFKTPPVALTTDKLEDTVCYLEMTEKIKSLCQSKPFHLIEYLTFNIYKTIEQALKEKNHMIDLINIEVCKVAPPVPDLHGGVSFTYSHQS